MGSRAKVKATKFQVHRLGPSQTSDLELISLDRAHRGDRGTQRGEAEQVGPEGSSREKTEVDRSIVIGTME
jgi:hypothetical protein